MYRPPISAIVNVWTKYENFKSDAVVVDSAKNGTDGHQMEQIMGKPSAAPKIKTSVFKMALSDMHAKLYKYKYKYSYDD